MVKSVLGVAHQGLRDWVIQRISAVIMAIYSIFIISYLVSHANLSFAEWSYLFSLGWVKVGTLIFIFCLLYHAWLGMWTIFTDYVKCYVIRSILHVLVILMLTACFIWSVMILWSV